jgi:hypothetical protein
MESARTCIGERVVSLLQYIKRPVKFITSSLSSEALMDCRPFSLYSYAISPSDGVLRRPYIYGDSVSLISTLYTYGRGSIRWNVTPDNTTNDINFKTIMYEIKDFVGNEFLKVPFYPTASAPITEYALVGTTFHRLAATGGIQAEFPHYQQLPARLNRVTNVDSTNFNSGGAEPIDIYSNNYRARFQSMGANATGVELYRSAGDDYQLGFFIGIPPIIVSTAL